MTKNSSLRTRRQINKALRKAKQAATFTVADYLLTRLQQLGLQKVFQVPGDYVSDFTGALDNFDGIDAVPEVCELGAGYAADGYARIKGIGAVSVQYGVGTLSVLNAIAGAFVERNPVVVITASPNTHIRNAFAHKNIMFHHSTGDLNSGCDIYKNVTVAAEILKDVDEAIQQIDAALISAITHRRPIYLEAYQDVWGTECSTPQFKQLENDILPCSAKSDTDALNNLVSKTLSGLAEAKKPLILLGVEVSRFGLRNKIIELLSLSGIPYSTTTLGKTCISETEGKFIGTFSGAASNQWTSDLIEASDKVLSIGTTFTDDYLEFMEQHYDSMISVDSDVARIGDQRFAHIQLQEFVEVLCRAFKQNTDFPRHELKRPIIPYLHSNEPELLAKPLCYRNFFNVLYAHLFQSDLMEKTNLILGESSALYQASRLIGLEQGTFIADAAWGSIGHETGCVSGVSLASDKRSMVVAGDGGFMMMSQSISTLLRNRLNSVIFVMSNEVYAIEHSFEDVSAFAHDGDFASANKLPRWNYQSLAESHGITGYQVSTCEELLKCLELLKLESDEPALVEVLIDKRDLAPALGEMVKSITGRVPEYCS